MKEQTLILSLKGMVVFIEPRPDYSFNNPDSACPTCEGFEVRRDPEKVVPDR